jgi:hypothetical protein
VSTALDIILAAYAKSAKNQGDRLATQSAETLDALNRALRLAFAAGSRVNPEYFSLKTNVPLSSGSWARPAGAESIIAIRGGSDVQPASLVGKDIVVVPFTDEAADEGSPCIYELGQKFFPTGPLAPTSGSLDFFYAAQPSLLVTVNDTLDPLWPTRFDGLLVCELALWLATKDGRAEDVQLTSAEVGRWQRLYVAHLEHATPIQVRRFGVRREFNLNTLYPNIPDGV